MDAERYRLEGYTDYNQRPERLTWAIREQRHGLCSEHSPKEVNVSPCLFSLDEVQVIGLISSPVIWRPAHLSGAKYYIR